MTTRQKFVSSRSFYFQQSLDSPRNWYAKWGWNPPALKEAREIWLGATEDAKKYVARNPNPTKISFTV